MSPRVKSSKRVSPTLSLEEASMEGKTGFPHLQLPNWVISLLSSQEPERKEEWLSGELTRKVMNNT